jgi:hypothetical protein
MDPVAPELVGKSLGPQCSDCCSRASVKRPAGFLNCIIIAAEPVQHGPAAPGSISLAAVSLLTAAGAYSS